MYPDKYGTKIYPDKYATKMYRDKYSTKKYPEKYGTKMYPDKFHTEEYIYIYFFKLGFTPCKAEQPLRGMELQEKSTKKITGYRKSV